MTNKDNTGEILKEAMNGAQAEYRRLIALLGHSWAQQAYFEKEVQDYKTQLEVITKKIRNYESQMPKEETTTGEKQDGQTTTDTGTTGTAAA